MVGKYIVIEGQDSTGKSTQVEMLAQKFRQQGKSVITMHEPDGDLPQTHALRDLIKDKTFNLEPLALVLLFSAARLELWTKLAAPLFAKGGIVISARNWWSTLAYQGYGQGIPLDTIIDITRQILPPSYIQPTHSVILTLDNKTRLARQTLRDNNSMRDTFESKPNSFQEKVDNGYLKIAKELHIPVVDASPSAQAIHTELLKLFSL